MDTSIKEGRISKLQKGMLNSFSFMKMIASFPQISTRKCRNGVSNLFSSQATCRPACTGFLHARPLLTPTMRPFSLRLRSGAAMEGPITMDQPVWKAWIADAQCSNQIFTKRTRDPHNRGVKLFSGEWLRKLSIHPFIAMAFAVVKGVTD